MEKCYKCGKDAAPGRFLKVNDCWTQEGFHWYAACEECYEKYGEGVHHVVHESEPKKMVKKIKLFARCDADEVIREVNDFIRDKNVIDIQYRPLWCNNANMPVNGTMYTNVLSDRVMVVYEEEE